MTIAAVRVATPLNSEHSKTTSTTTTKSKPHHSPPEVPALVQFSIVLSTLSSSTFFECLNQSTFSPPTKPLMP
jgi:hypothetical protein